MILIDNREVTDPRLNLALEEFVFRNYTEGEYLLLYINRASVILGKHQNVLEEVDLDYADANGIEIVRRISGGGAVYHDTGNLNFSVITAHDPRKHNNYDSFLAPAIAALDELGIKARLNSRNSVVVSDGRKISGNAQFASRGRMLSHGTLLFNADLDVLNGVLRPVGEPIESHAVQSVRSRTVNLSDLLSSPMTIEEFREHIARYYTGSPAGEELPQRTLSDDEWRQAEKLAAEKYGSWEWNIGRSPKFSITHRLEKGGESVPVRFRVVDGMIESVEPDPGTPVSDAISEHVRSLKKRVRGERYEPSVIRSLLADI